MARLQWLLHYSATDMQFPSYISYEATSLREGVFNTYNAHTWAVDNSHGTRTRAAQQCFTVNVWADYGEQFNRAILPTQIDTRQYFVLFQEILPETLNNIRHIFHVECGFTMMEHNRITQIAKVASLDRTFGNK